MTERLPIFESVLADFRAGLLTPAPAQDSAAARRGRHNWSVDRPSPRPRTDIPTEPSLSTLLAGDRDG